MRPTDPLSGEANRIQALLDNGDRVQLLRRLDAGENELWVGYYEVPQATASGTHTFTVEASAAGVVTDIPVHMDVPAVDSENTGVTTTGRFGVDANPCTADEVCAADVCSDGSTRPFGCIDHYLCYGIKAADSFTPTTRTLADQLGSGSFEVKKVSALCPPASPDGETIIDAATHEEAYEIKSASKHKSASKQKPQARVTVYDRFGSLIVDIGQPDRLLVPTNKGLAMAVPPPALGVADHYECYKVKIDGAGHPFAKGVQVPLADQFETRLYDVKKPQRLCNPTNKNGEGIVRPLAHLMCYQVKAAKKQPKLVKTVGIHTNNQLGPGRLDTVKEAEVCVPAVTTP